MFLPNFNADAEKAALKEHCDRIERWALDIIPRDLREEVIVSVQEVHCGDPECAPIDTVVTVLFDRFVQISCVEFKIIRSLT
jgi:hypothetical protein